VLDRSTFAQRLSPVRVLRRSPFGRFECTVESGGSLVERGFDCAVECGARLRARLRVRLRARSAALAELGGLMASALPSVADSQLTSPLTTDDYRLTTID
jgi:hypothetical protein